MFGAAGDIIRLTGQGNRIWNSLDDDMRACPTRR